MLRKLTVRIPRPTSAYSVVEPVALGNVSVFGNAGTDVPDGTSSTPACFSAAVLRITGVPGLIDGVVDADSVLISMLRVTIHIAAIDITQPTVSMTWRRFRAADSARFEAALGMEERCELGGRREVSVSVRRRTL